MYEKPPSPWDVLVLMERSRYLHADLPVWGYRCSVMCTRVRGCVRVFLKEGHIVMDSKATCLYGGVRVCGSRPLWHFNHPVSAPLGEWGQFDRNAFFFLYRTNAHPASCSFFFLSLFHCLPSVTTPLRWFVVCIPETFYLRVNFSHRCREPEQTGGEQWFWGRGVGWSVIFRKCLTETDYIWMLKKGSTEVRSGE